MADPEPHPPGPHNQAGLHNQAGAVPFRRRGKRLQFCLITSVRAGRWQFPKGFIDPGETAAETALKESLEEAGLHGRIVGEPLGDYQYAKWGSVHSVLVMLMEVTRCDRRWFEDDLRQRRWATPEEARRMLDPPELCELLDTAVQRLGG